MSYSKNLSNFQSSYPAFSFIVTFSQIDWAGRIFYSRIFEIAQMAMEKFINNTSLVSISNLLKYRKPLPVVIHTEADFFIPIKLGDKLIVEISCVHIGITSFVLRYDIIKQDRSTDSIKSKKILVSQVKVTHVLVKEETKKTKLSVEWKKILHKIYSPNFEKTE